MNIIKVVRNSLAVVVVFSGVVHGAISGLGEGIFASIDTNKGNIVIELEYQKTPNTVGNFVGLVEGTKKNDFKDGMGFYDGMKFHRVIDNFMVQTGDPLGNGTGGPGYKFADEITNLKHDRAGTLSMANSGPNTNGSQFFITHGPTNWLNGAHTVFGYVIQGMDVVNKIEKGDVMESIRIIRNGVDAIYYDANKVRISKPVINIEALFAPSYNKNCEVPYWAVVIGYEEKWLKKKRCKRHGYY
jgi:peptidylprolyl isomerase